MLESPALILFRFSSAEWLLRPVLLMDWLDLFAMRDSFDELRELTRTTLYDELESERATGT